MKVTPNNRPVLARGKTPSGAKPTVQSQSQSQPRATNPPRKMGGCLSCRGRKW